MCGAARRHAWHTSARFGGAQCPDAIGFDVEADVDPKLKDFLTELAANPKKLGEFIADADKAMKAVDLPAEDQEILKSGDVSRIHARLMGMPERAEVPPVVVVTADLLSRSMSEYSRQLQSGSTAGLTLFPNMPPQTPMIVTLMSPTVAPTVSPVWPNVPPTVSPVWPTMTPTVAPTVSPVWPMMTPMITPQVTPQFTPMYAPMYMPTWR